MANNIGPLTADYYTLSFIPDYGWPSFYTFDPEDMIGMNSHLYSFKGGNLYQHNSFNSPRNEFYGERSPSRLIGVINNEPSTVKTFKTFNIEGDSPWDVTLESNLISGEIESQWFQLREGEYHTFVRRAQDDGNYNLRSAHGIGTVNSVAVSGSNQVLTFGFTIDSIISVGDKLFMTSGGGLTEIGTITARTSTTITVNTLVPAVTSGRFIVAIKDSVAESSGVSGYYMRYEMENDSPNRIEIFSIGSSIFKNYP